MHPFRFAAHDGSIRIGRELAEFARRVEGVGFSTFQLPDHLGSQLAPLPALQAVADATSTLRVGTQVLANDYRHPAILAKEYATLDLLSDGRLELGIGAGWKATEYDAIGLPFDRAGVRVDRLIEAIAVIKKCFADGPFSFTGEHYAVSEYDSQPKPRQRPVPLLIGGGSKRMLGVAGREADIVGLNFDLRSARERDKGRPAVAGIVTSQVAATGTAAAVDQKLQWVKAGAGDRYESLELNLTPFLFHITDDPNTTADSVANRLGLDREELLDSPFTLIGSIERMQDILVERRERFGISYISFPFRLINDACDTLAPLVGRLSGT